MRFNLTPLSHLATHLRIGHRKVPRALAVTDHKQWQRMLASAHSAQLPVACLCNGPDKPLPMYVSRTGDTWTVKRAPGTGPHHHPSCRSNGETVSCDSSGAHQSSSTELPSSQVDVDLVLPTLQGDGTGPATSARPTGLANSHVCCGGNPIEPTVERMTLGCFLALLWERAGLNHWSPTEPHRGLSLAYLRLGAAAAGLKLGSMPAAQSLFIPDTDLTESALRTKDAMLMTRLRELSNQAPPDAERTLVVVGELRSLFESRHGAGLRLKGLSDEATIWLSEDLAGSLAERFAHQIDRFLTTKKPSISDDKHPRLFCISTVRLSSQGRLNATACTLMETNVDFVPVGSGHELLLCDHLVAHRRCFTKPVRCVSALEPAFALYDCDGGDWALEVLESGSPELIRRTKMKMAEYHQVGMRLWQWKASTCSTIPPLPAPAKAPSIVLVGG